MGCGRSRHIRGSPQAAQTAAAAGAAAAAPAGVNDNVAVESRRFYIRRGKSDISTDHGKLQILSTISPTVNGLVPSDEPMSILLVFPREDAQSLSFLKASERLELPCETTATAESAMESYICRHHDLVILDRRCQPGGKQQLQQFEFVDSLVKAMRAISQSEFTTFVAVTGAVGDSNDSSESLSELIRIGFDMKFTECVSVDACAELLTSVRHNNFQFQQKLAALGALFTALDACTDAVEITNDKLQIQYINAAQERLLGRPMSELIGRNSRDHQAAKTERTPDEAAALLHTLRKGREWEEDFCGPGRPAASGPISHQLQRRRQTRRFLPVKGRHGKVQHIVSVTTKCRSENKAASKQACGRKLTKRSSGNSDPCDEPRIDSFDQIENKDSESSLANMQSPSEIPEQFISYLEGDDEWEFDIMELERVTNNRPLVYLGMKILQRFNICQLLQCSEDTMLNWLQVIQENYHQDNCYHNATHGADVMQSSAYFLERSRVKAALDEMDEAASLLGALVHDLDHPGRTNPFLINSRHRLALLYNDLSVLESHHVSLAFQLTSRDERINIFKNLAQDEYKSLRQSIVDVVLATEMARHFEHVGKFANQIVAPLLAGKDAGPGDEASGVGNMATEDESLEMLSKPENRALIMRVLIKCSDISNQCRPLKLCKEWSRRISEEYFQQTDEEKARDLPIVMPMFDRTTCNLPQAQISFIDFFLREMFSVWHAFCDVPQLLDNMNNNYAYWKRMAAERPAPKIDDSGNRTAEQ